MQEKARTVSFTHKIEVSGNKMTYSEKTGLDIYGKEFDPTDNNTLVRVEGNS